MKPVFIGGCGRSGRTLLASMLGSHSQCLATPQAKFHLRVYRSCMQDFGKVKIETAFQRIQGHWSFRIWNMDLGRVEDLDPKIRTYSELLEWIVVRYGLTVDKVNPAIWVDFTPANSKCAPTLLQLYPHAKVINLIRDGRAVAASVLPLDWGPNCVATAARWWIENVGEGLAAKSALSPECFKEIRYEQLVQDPETTLREICDFVQIEYEPQMIEGKGFEVIKYTARQHTLVGSKPNAKRLSGWRTDLSAREIEIFESIAGNFLNNLGYELVYGMRARRMNWVEKTKAGIQDVFRSAIWNRLRRNRRIEGAIQTAAARSHGPG